MNQYQVNCSCFILSNGTQLLKHPEKYLFIYSSWAKKTPGVRALALTGPSLIPPWTVGAHRLLPRLRLTLEIKKLQKLLKVGVFIDYSLDKIQLHWSLLGVNWRSRLWQHPFYLIEKWHGTNKFLNQVTLKSLNDLVFSLPHILDKWLSVISDGFCGRHWIPKRDRDASRGHEARTWGPLTPPTPQITKTTVYSTQHTAYF